MIFHCEITYYIVGNGNCICTPLVPVQQVKNPILSDLSLPHLSRNINYNSNYRRKPAENAEPENEEEI